MISPGPLVRQKGRPGHSSDSRLFWKAVRSEGAGFCRFLAGGGARKVCSLRTLSARQGRARKVLPCRLAVGCGKARHTAFRRQSPCERVLRTRSRRPTPSRRCRAVVSKEGIARAGDRCTWAWASCCLCSSTTLFQRPVRLCWRHVPERRFLLLLLVKK